MPIAIVVVIVVAVVVEGRFDIDSDYDRDRDGPVYSSLQPRPWPEPPADENSTSTTTSTTTPTQALSATSVLVAQGPDQSGGGSRRYGHIALRTFRTPLCSSPRYGNSGPTAKAERMCQRMAWQYSGWGKEAWLFNRCLAMPSVGFPASNPRQTRQEQWATTHLKFCGPRLRPRSSRQVLGPGRARARDRPIPAGRLPEG